MTFSLAARCTLTGAFGIVIASSSPAVAARCARVRTGVGVACSQNITDPRLGDRLLYELQKGSGSEQALARVVASEPTAPYRQLIVVDCNGNTAAHSGEHTLGVHMTCTVPDVASAGNLLANQDVPQAMVDSFLSATGSFGAKLIRALSVGLRAGGEAGPVHSAGILIADDVAWPVADLRVDWHETDPIGQLTLLWDRWEPQLRDYVTRGLNPASSPAYGVPGDLAAEPVRDAKL